MHPGAVFVDPRGPNADVLADALDRLGTWIEINGVDSAGAFRAARDFLLRRPPRVTEDGFPGPAGRRNNGRCRETDRKPTRRFGAGHPGAARSWENIQRFADDLPTGTAG